MIKKRLPAIFTALLCAVLLMSVSLSAVSAASVVNDHYALTDDADYFDSSETEQLKAELEQAYQLTGWQLIIHTSNQGISSDDMDTYYNRDYYDRQSFGKDTVMFVIDLASNNRIIITHGKAMYYFDDERMSSIKSKLRPYLNDNDFFGASEKFIGTCESYFVAGEGTGENTNIMVNLKQDNPFLYSFRKYGIFVIPAGIIVGLLVFFITSRRYKNTGKSGTYNLAENSSVSLDDQQDIFITQHTTVTRISSDNDSSGGGSSGGGGGGSTHGSSGSF